MEERYSRQSSIKGWDQDRLANLRVLVAGSGRLSDFVLVDLLCMGFENITRAGLSERFEFNKINPRVNLDQTGEEITNSYHAQVIVDSADLVIDASNDRVQSSSLNKACVKMKKPYLRGFTYDNGFGFSRVFSDCPLGENIIGDMLASAYLCDEARKGVFHLDGEFNAEEFTIDLGNIYRINKRILQIGAGAIGTFSAVALAELGAKVDIYDFDSVEESNLNRQFLFYEGIGKNKAILLAERLASGNVRGLDRKVSEDFDPRGYDYVFSCVDNNKARYYLNNACRKFNVPLVNGGSSLFGSDAMCYFPGKCACIDCQTCFGLTESMAEDPRRRGSACFAPSMIVPNQISAGLMVACLNRSLGGNYKKLSYSTGEPILEVDISKECFNECGKR